MTDEEKKAKQKEYRDKWRSKPENRERLRASAQQWREENRDRFLETHRALRARPEYKEREKARVVESRRTNPFKFSAQKARRRAKTEGWECNVDAEYLETIWTGVCPITGATLHIGQEKGTIPDTNLASLDRLDSTKGYIKGNVQYIAFRCNNIKTDASFEEFEQIYFWWKKRLENEAAT